MSTLIEKRYRGTKPGGKPAAKNQEGSRHGQKVKQGQLRAVLQGRYGTGPAPFGYKRGDGNDPALVVNEHEATIVKTIFREYLRCRSTGKVVNLLNSRGIRTRKGRKWSRQAVAIILENRTYRGRVRYGDLETQGLHEAIIEPSLFYKAHALKARRRRNTSRGAENKKLMRV